jgi:hypothetical protein
MSQHVSTRYEYRDKGAAGVSDDNCANFFSNEIHFRFEQSYVGITNIRQEGRDAQREPHHVFIFQIAMRPANRVRHGNVRQNSLCEPPL